MARDGDKKGRWRFGTRDLFWLMTAIAVGLGAMGYAAKNSVSTFPQLVMLLAGWFTLGGCIGATLWWLRNGSTTDILDGVLLGLLLALLPPLLVFFL